MKGLLLKDCYLLWKYAKLILVFIAVFLIIPFFGVTMSFYLFYPCMVAGILPITLFSYDERDRWNAYSGTLPYSRTQLVSAKYLMGLLLIGAMLLISLLMQAVRMALDGNFSMSYLAQLAAMLLFTGCLSPALTLPFVLRFGAERGRIAYYIVIAALVAGFTIVMGIREERSFELVSIPFSSLNDWLPLLLALGAAALYALSWRVSVALYQKCELR